MPPGHSQRLLPRTSSPRPLTTSTRSPTLSSSLSPPPSLTSSPPGSLHLDRSPSPPRRSQRLKARQAPPSPPKLILHFQAPSGKPVSHDRGPSSFAGPSLRRGRPYQLKRGGKPLPQRRSSPPLPPYDPPSPVQCPARAPSKPNLWPPPSSAPIPARFVAVGNERYGGQPFGFPQAQTGPRAPTPPWMNPNLEPQRPRKRGRSVEEFWEFVQTANQAIDWDELARRTPTKRWRRESRRPRPRRQTPPTPRTPGETSSSTRVDEQKVAESQPASPAPQRPHTSTFTTPRPSATSAQTSQPSANLKSPATSPYHASPLAVTYRVTGAPLGIISAASFQALSRRRGQPPRIPDTFFLGRMDAPPFAFPRIPWEEGRPSARRSNVRWHAEGVVDEQEYLQEIGANEAAGVMEQDEMMDLDGNDGEGGMGREEAENDEWDMRVDGEKVQLFASCAEPGEDRVMEHVMDVDEDPALKAGKPTHATESTAATNKARPTFHPTSESGSALPSAPPSTPKPRRRRSVRSPFPSSPTVTSPPRHFDSADEHLMPSQPPHLPQPSHPSKPSEDAVDTALPAISSPSSLRASPAQADTAFHEIGPRATGTSVADTDRPTKSTPSEDPSTTVDTGEEMGVQSSASHPTLAVARRKTRGSTRLAQTLPFESMSIATTPRGCRVSKPARRRPPKTRYNRIPSSSPSASPSTSPEPEQAKQSWKIRIDPARNTLTMYRHEQ